MQLKKYIMQEEKGQERGREIAKRRGNICEVARRHTARSGKDT